jgi:sugar phosphate isomerase/epimerase
MTIQQVFIAPKEQSPEECIAYAQAHGHPLELAEFMYPKNLMQHHATIARYKTLLQGFSHPIAMHGPVFDVNAVSLDPELKALSIQRYHQAIECALELNASYLVFHSQWTPIYKVADCYQPWLEATIAFYKELDERYLKDTNLTLVIENFLDESPRILNDLIEGIQSPNIRACLDIGHVNLFSTLPACDWLDQLGSNLAYIHAHNNWGRLDEHLPFSDGSIDIEGFLNHALHVPRNYQLVVEVLTLEGIQESLPTVTKLLQQRHLISMGGGSGVSTYLL